MSLNGLHVLVDYNSDLHRFFYKVEGFDGSPYFDTATPRLVTIGIGFNIDTVSKNLGYVLDELLINGAPSERDPTRTANQIFKEVIDSVSDGDRISLISKLNSALRENFPSLYGPYGVIKPNGTFSLNETEAYRVLDKIITDKQPELDAKLSAYGIDPALLYGTQEYLALTSLNYNTKSGSTDLIGNGLRRAIAAGDRAEAWYEIRYNSNKNALNSNPPADGYGIANRRYKESDLFGLYDYGVVDTGEAKSVYRMFTRHRNTILAYDTAYDPTDVNAGSTTLESQFGAAYGLLTIEFVDNAIGPVPISWDHIQVGEDQTTLYYRGTDNDILIGTNESDLLFGESGADILQGGGGNDVLYGGTGTDLYRIGLSDGNDTIVETPDADGVARGVIVYGDDTPASVVVPSVQPMPLAVGTRTPDTAGVYAGPGRFALSMAKYPAN